MSSFTKAVETFKKSAKEWLTDEDAPALVALEASAKALDVEVTAALLNAYGTTYRSLLKKKPAQTEEADELSKLLSEAEDDD